MVTIFYPEFCSFRMWNTKLRSWLKYTGGSSQWASDIKYNKDDNSIEAFRFQVKFFIGSAIIALK